MAHFKITVEPLDAVGENNLEENKVILCDGYSIAAYSHMKSDDDDEGFMTTHLAFMGDRCSVGIFDMLERMPDEIKEELALIMMAKRKGVELVKPLAVTKKERMQ